MEVLVKALIPGRFRLYIAQAMAAKFDKKKAAQKKAVEPSKMGVEADDMKDQAGSGEVLTEALVVSRSDFGGRFDWASLVAEEPNYYPYKDGEPLCFRSCPYFMASIEVGRLPSICHLHFLKFNPETTITIQRDWSSGGWGSFFTFPEFKKLGWDRKLKRHFWHGVSASGGGLHNEPFYIYDDQDGFDADGSGPKYFTGSSQARICFCVCPNYSKSITVGEAPHLCYICWLRYHTFLPVTKRTGSPTVWEAADALCYDGVKGCLPSCRKFTKHLEQIGIYKEGEHWAEGYLATQNNPFLCW